MFRTISAVTGIQRYIAIGLIIALALVTAWGFRVDHLRAHYRDIIDRTILVLPEPLRPKRDRLPLATEALLLAQQRAVDDRNRARDAIRRQSDAIVKLQGEGIEARSRAQRNWDLYQSAKADRDRWIAKARQAATRTERLTCEQELAEIEEVMDALRRDGF